MKSHRRQHELAPIYTTTNIAADHNQLTMEMHEAVWQTVTGLSASCMKSRLPASTAAANTTTGRSSTDTGVNLLEPGEIAAENLHIPAYS